MTDLHVVGLLAAKPGAEHSVRTALLELVEPSRDEEGCITYDVYASDTQFGTYLTVETWRSHRDLDAHLHSPHVQRAMAAAAADLLSPPTIHPLTAVTPAGTPHLPPPLDDDVKQEETPSRSIS